MADATDSKSSLGKLIFRETALSKMSSADDLDHYLKITNPAAWVLIGAVAALLVAALIWGFTATLPVQSSTTGVLKNGEIVCFLPLDNTDLATTESKVTAAGHETHVISIDDNPYSKREVAEVVGSDYVVSQYDAQWSYKITIALPEGRPDWNDGDDVPIQITTKEAAPLSFLFGGAQS